MDLNRDFPDLTKKFYINLRNGGPLDHLQPDEIDVEKVNLNDVKNKIVTGSEFQKYFKGLT